MYLKKLYLGSIQINLYYDKDDVYEDDEYSVLFEVSIYPIRQQLNLYVKDSDLSVSIESEVYRTDLLQVVDNEEYTCIKNPSNKKCIYYKTYFYKKSNDAYIIYERKYGMQNKLNVLCSSQFIYALLFFIQKKNYLILHSSLVKMNKGIMFCGQSGSGKTTISKIFNQCGYKILTDETVLIEINDDNVLAYGTPWSGRENLFYQRDSVEVNSIFVIEHSPYNTLKEESDIFFVNYFLKQSYPFFYIQKSVINQIKKIQKIILMVRNRYVLGFVPNSSVCNFLESYL